MAASTVVPLSESSQAAFITYYNSMQNIQSDSLSDMRVRFEKVDKAYQREVDESEEQARAKAANEAGDTSRFQNITVPVVMPQVETAVTYQASVFLTGQPIFGVVASPEFEDAALQLETVIDENAVKGGWARQLMLFFRDGYKYNFAPLEVTWKQEVTASIETDLAKNQTEGIPKKLIWSGNSVKRLDPYNTFVDPRVAPTEVYKDGEFAGYTEYMTRVKLKTFINELPDKIIANIIPAFESGVGSAPRSNTESRNYYIPTVNKEVTDPTDATLGTNWMAWAGLNEKEKTIAYKDTYEVTTMYCKVMPIEFGLRLPSAKTPQVFKLIIVNHQHIIYCERQTNAHNWIPILIGQPKEDGLAYQTKSLATDAKPFQEVASAFMNSIIASRRRAITDRVLYDPSRIARAHINSANPSAKIPVRPAAYGKVISDAVYQFPYREDQAGFAMSQIGSLMELANHTSGQNKASQGQFVKGNKTQDEFDSVMQNANGRSQTESILIEHQVFLPLKTIIKLNTLQYQGGTTVYNRDKQTAIEIDPVRLRKSVLDFKVSDGLVPDSKLISTENFSVALQVLGTAPQIGAGYNMAPMFSYLMKIKGANLTPFEKPPEQVAFEQALASWQQMVTTAIEKGVDPQKLPVQPNPQAFGYVPANSTPKPQNPGEQSASSTPTPGPQ